MLHIFRKRVNIAWKAIFSRLRSFYFVFQTWITQWIRWRTLHMGKHSFCELRFWTHIEYILYSRNFETLPKFKEQLKDVRCCDGDSVRLECNVEATPAPATITWEKDGKKLQQTSDDFSTSYVDGRAILSIKRVYPEDEGEYKCIASNSIGKTESSACTIVDGMWHTFNHENLITEMRRTCFFSAWGERELSELSVDETK